MAWKVCSHPVFPSLRARLIARKIKECPTCRIRLYVCEIEEVQAALKHRSGIFESRAAACPAEGSYDRNERNIHKALMKRWSLAKIGLYKDLLLFETLGIEGAEKTCWSLQLDKATELWEEVKDECCSVPGYRTTQEVVVHVNSESESKTSQAAYYSLNAGPRCEEGDEDNGWQTVKPRARTTCRSSDQTLSASAHVTGTVSEVQNHDGAVQNIKVPLKIAHGSYWDGRNRFDLVREVDFDESLDLYDALDVKAAPKSPDGPEVMTDVSASPCRLTKSSLKRKRSSISPEKPQLHGSVHIAESVTVICDAIKDNITGFPTGQCTMQRPHSSYTNAEKARRRSNFYRPSKRYKPRTWALVGEIENVNTSHYKTTWEEYDAIIDSQFCREKREESRPE